MNKEEMKILEYLSDNLGYGGNILEMTKNINKEYGPAYYPNIYNTIKKLEKIDIIDIKHEGNNKIIMLNTKNPLSIYYISETENYKNQKITIFRELLNDILKLTQNFDIFSICSLDTKQYLIMNRLELLILNRNSNENIELMKELHKLEYHYGMSIDPIILTLNEFIDKIKTDELDIIIDLILKKNIIYNIDGFWEIILENSINTKYKKLDKYPQDITRDELAYNYNRFGFQLYERFKPSDKIAIEPIIFSMSLNDEARIRYGSILLLYKNIENINLSYLFYIFKRYNKLSELKGMLTLLFGSINEPYKNKIKSYINFIPDEPTIYNENTFKKYINIYTR